MKNEYYESEKAYLAAAIQVEYEAIFKSGFLLPKSFALADIVTDPRHTLGLTGLVFRDLALPSDPMDAAVRMRNPELDVIGTTFPRSFDR
jgi:hypothetical protein